MTYAEAHAATATSRWQRMQELFEAALACDPAARAEFLVGAEPDARLRAEVQALLDADAPAQAGVEQRVHAALADALPALAPGLRLGAYRLLAEIGSGGMGTVFLAERADEAFEQRVAIKLLRGIPTREGAERMRHERQILADLDHPNIARLIDGGESAEGQPYLVMEYVEGESLLAWCTQRALGVRERLQLFAQLCHAVEHAHRHLVVHRDLKPDNVLVRADGKPVLLDFGIAKLLEEGVDAVVTGTHAFTPAYAAPEQQLGQGVTTATDVYSLGCILFDLLSDGAIADKRVVAPLPHVSACTTATAIARSLRGDLDTLVAKAVHADPARRYVSAHALADDVENYLAGRPLEAMPDSLVYRLRKAIVRHRYATAAATAVLMALAGFVWRLEIERTRALAAEAHAQAEAMGSERVLDYVVSMFESAAPEQTGKRSISPRELVDMGRRRLGERLGDQPEQQARLLAALGEIYLKLGQTEVATETLREAVALERKRGRTGRSAKSLYLLGYALNVGQHPADAEAALREAIDVQRVLPSDDGTLADQLSTLAIAQNRNGKPVAALATVHEALAHAERSDGPDGRRVGESLYAQAQVQIWNGDMAGARTSAERSLTILRARLPPDAPSVLSALGALADVHRDLGDYAQAESLLRQLLDLLLGAIDAGSAVAVGDRNNLGYVVLLRGRAREAKALFTENLEHLRERGAQTTPIWRITLKNLGMADAMLGDYSAAELQFRESIARVEAVNGKGATDPVASTYRQNLAEILLRRGRREEAHALLLPEVTGSETTPFFPTAVIRRQLLLAEWASAERQLDEARQYLAMAEQTLAGIDSSGHRASARWHAAELARTRGHLFVASGDLVRAEDAFSTSLHTLEEAQLGAHPYATEVGIELADVQWRRGERDQARQRLSTLAATVHEQFASNTQVTRDFDALYERMGLR